MSQFSQDVGQIIFLPSLFEQSSSKSSDDSLNEGGESKHKRFFLFTTCARCGEKNPRPFLRYCDKCFKVIVFYFCWIGEV